MQWSVKSDDFNIVMTNDITTDAQRQHQYVLQQNPVAARTATSISTCNQMHMLLYYRNETNAINIPTKKVTLTITKKCNIMCHTTNKHVMPLDV